MSNNLLLRAVRECAANYHELRKFLALTVTDTLYNPDEYYRLAKVYKRRTRQWVKFYYRLRGVSQ